MRAQFFSRRLSPLVGSIILCSCASQHATRPNTVPVAEQETPRTVSSSEWSPKQFAGFNRYVIEDSSTIAINNDSAHASSIQTRVVYTLTFAALADSFGLVAKPESLMMLSRKQNGRSQLDTNSVQSFSAAVSSEGRLSNIVEQTSVSCSGGIDPMATRLFELTISYPKKRIKIGEKWGDSVSMTTCRGKTPFVQHNVRSYELLELSTTTGDPTLKIRRNVSVSFIGASTDPKNHVEVAGAGSSSAILYANAVTGALVSSDGVSHSILTVTTARGSYPFSQNISTHIVKK